MASLPESSTFDAGVYQLELTDPVIGGPSGVSNTPLKNLANRTKYLKDHVDSIEANFAPKASPALTGTPTAPTPASGTNTTQLATTAFVQSAVAAAVPDLSPYAPKASPVFSGNPVAPTPAKFDADTSLATTAFVQAALGNYSGTVVDNDGGTLTLTAADAGQLVILNGTGSQSGNVALPALSSVPDGATFLIRCEGDAIWNLVASGTDKIVLGTGYNPSSVRIVNGDYAIIVKGSANWRCQGSISLKYSASFAYSQATSGYQKLPSGVIVQWGIAAASTTASDYRNFPIAFPNACMSGVASYAQWGQNGNGNAFQVVSASQFLITNRDSNGSATGGATAWIAFGY